MGENESFVARPIHSVRVCISHTVCLMCCRFLATTNTYWFLTLEMQSVSCVWDVSRDNWHQRIVTKLNVHNTAAAHVGSSSRWVVPVIGGD